MTASMVSNEICQRTWWCFLLKRSYADDGKHCCQEKDIYKTCTEAEEYIELSLSKQQALKCAKRFEFYYPLFGKKVIETWKEREGHFDSKLTQRDCKIPCHGSSSNC